MLRTDISTIRRRIAETSLYWADSYVRVRKITPLFALFVLRCKNVRIQVKQVEILENNHQTINSDISWSQHGVFGKWIHQGFLTLAELNRTDQH
jgi:hypothetical protein